MQLVPGGLRELHWHSNAAEWAYVIKGQCRVTTIDPEGRSQVVDFGVGDVRYFPRGFGHSIQGIGREECLFLLVFDNGYFSEFGTFSISDWIGLLRDRDPRHQRKRSQRHSIEASFHFEQLQNLGRPQFWRC